MELPGTSTTLRSSARPGAERRSAQAWRSNAGACVGSHAVTRHSFRIQAESGHICYTQRKKRVSIIKLICGNAFNS